MTWQRRLRLLIAIGGVGLAIVVGFAFQWRAAVRDDSVSPSDPKALVETIKFDKTRVNRDKEEVRIQADSTTAYIDGTARGRNLTITTTRSGGRVFVLKADRAEIGKDESSFVLEGNVHLENSDGLQARTERASYIEAEGVIRASGPVTFSRGRMSGSGIGFSYDRNRDRLRILQDVSVRAVAAGAEGGQEPITIASDTLELDRIEHLLRFEDPFTVTRGGAVIKAERGLARLTADEQGLQVLELRERSEITAAPGPPGSLQAMTGRDIDLRYGADGETLEHARINGAGVIRFTGETAGSGRQIRAETIEVPLAENGTRPMGLTARDRVELTLPADESAAARTITADSLDGRGDAVNGLTGALFTGRVVFRESGEGADRSASSEMIQVATRPGLGAIDEATFLRPVEFVDGSMTARAPRGRYMLASGRLDLARGESGAARPNVRNDRISVDADQIEVVLEGPKLHAKGAVRSVLQPSRDTKDGKTPSMFKDDQPVNGTADDLTYEGDAETATYAGTAQLWQKETTIKGAAITIDGKSGDLKATGEPVATTTMLTQTSKEGKKERSIANARSRELQYRESDRRATYTGEAYVNGPQGELRAARIELFLQPSGDELERLEAYEAVTLTDKRYKIAGDRLTYTSADERYLVLGTPITITDECSGVTEGRSLTYLKAADRITVDGSEQMRTRTKGGAKCP
jgi:LPS export ABC transporter protein LptC